MHNTHNKQWFQTDVKEFWKLFSLNAPTAIYKGGENGLFKVGCSNRD